MKLVFSQPTYIIPQSDIKVKFFGHGCSTVQTLKVLVNDTGVFKVVGVGLQLVCVIVLKPQVVARGVADDFVCPSVAVAHDGVFAVVCVECVHL